MALMVLGIAVMIGLILAMNWFVSAKPKTVLKALKWGLLSLIIVVILFLFVTGKFAMALWALPVLLPWIMRARMFARTAKNFSRMAGGSGQTGQASSVTSKYLDMELNHDSGDMNGYVRNGRHAGRKLDDLSLDQLTDLHSTYQSEDIESARLLAAYLDRTNPDWRDDADAYDDQEQSRTSPSNSQMNRAEALRILGLEDPVDVPEIKAAYHRLVGSMHPDRGGSAYLTSKINEARDFLLNS